MSSSATDPSRHFVFVVTNHPDFRHLFPRSRHAPTIQTSLSSQGVLSNDREDILQNLLHVELREFH